MLEQRNQLSSPGVKPRNSLPDLYGANTLASPDGVVYAVSTQALNGTTVAPL